MKSPNVKKMNNREVRELIKSNTKLTEAIRSAVRDARAMNEFRASLDKR
ncbi:hypothetical protein BH11PLA1_BH11PLA1_07060 [soil metagenome]